MPVCAIAGGFEQDWLRRPPTLAEFAKSLWRDAYPGSVSVTALFGAANSGVLSDPSVAQLVTPAALPACSLQCEEDASADHGFPAGRPDGDVAAPYRDGSAGLSSRIGA